MSASIHINGTGSSIIDTVFVCRSTGSVPRRWLADNPAGVAALVTDDLQQLRQGRVSPTRGDTRCITYGHLIRLVIWNLRTEWQSPLPIDDRLARLQQTMLSIATPEAVEACLTSPEEGSQTQMEMRIAETTAIIKAKITSDDGTARDKVARILRLANMRDEAQRAGRTPFQVIACIDGRGFGQRRQDMRDMLKATRGKVFTLATLDRLVPSTEIERYRSQCIP